MRPRKPFRGKARGIPAFNAQAFLDSSGMAKTIVEYGRGESIFRQGDVCKHVLWIPLKINSSLLSVLLHN